MPGGQVSTASASCRKNLARVGSWVRWSWLAWWSSSACERIAASASTTWLETVRKASTISSRTGRCPPTSWYRSAENVSTFQWPKPGASPVISAGSAIMASSTGAPSRSGPRPARLATYRPVALRRTMIMQVPRVSATICSDASLPRLRTVSMSAAPSIFEPLAASTASRALTRSWCTAAM